MGFPVSKSNSIQFTVDGEKLAFAVILDDFINQYQFGLYKLTPTGEWNCPIFNNENGIIEDNLTNEKVMEFGSVANFIKSQFPTMQNKLRSYLGSVIPKPDQSNKPQCVGYDLNYDVQFNLGDLSFSLNKEPPLSHAR